MCVAIATGNSSQPQISSEEANGNTSNHKDRVNGNTSNYKDRVNGNTSNYNAGRLSFITWLKTIMNSPEKKHDYEAGIPLTEALSEGKALRELYESLSFRQSSQPAPSKWNGGWSLRCSVGFGILAGTGLGVAGCWYYGGRDPASNEPETTRQSYDAEPSLNLFMPHPGSGGVPEESFGDHRLHHDNNDATNSATQKTAAKTIRSDIPSYKASDGRPASDKPETTRQSYDAEPPLNPFMPHPGSGGVLEESFGDHRLHHDNNDATDSATQKTVAKTIRSGIPLYKASDERKKREPAPSQGIEICQEESVLKRCQQAHRDAAKRGMRFEKLILSMGEKPCHCQCPGSDVNSRKPKYPYMAAGGAIKFY